MARADTEPASTSSPSRRRASSLFDRELDWHVAIVCVVLGGLYIMISSGLILFNERLLDAERFPFAVSLTLLQTAACSCLSLALRAAAPSLFPALEDPLHKVGLTGTLKKVLVPISLIFSAQVVLSNTATVTGPAAFLQVMKGGSVAVVYGLSLAAGADQFDGVCALLVLGILGATVLNLQGALHVSSPAFILQLTSIFFEGGKLVLQSLALSSFGLDALSYVLLVSPLCFVVQSILMSVAICVHGSPLFAAPSWSDFVRWAPELFANALVAFLLNVVLALLVKHTSATTVALVNLVKVAGLVAAGAYAADGDLSVARRTGIALQFAFVACWCYRKAQRTDDGRKSGADTLLPAAEAKLEAGSQFYGSVEKGGRVEK